MLNRELNVDAPSLAKLTRTDNADILACAQKDPQCRENWWLTGLSVITNHGYDALSTVSVRRESERRVDCLPNRDSDPPPLAVQPIISLATDT